MKLSKWGAERNLMEEWFLDAVVWITTAWCSFPDTATELAWGLPASMSCGRDHRFGSVAPKLQRVVKTLATAGTKPPSISIYNPVMQTRQEHLASVVEALNKYQTEQEDRFLEAGFTPTLRKRKRGRSAWQHMDWFIKYQIKGLQTKKFSLTVSETAKNKAIRDIAKLLRIHLRSRTSKG